MKFSKSTIVLLAICGILLFFGYREWQIQKAPPLQILGEKNSLLIVHRQQLFGFGDIENSRIQSSSRAMTSYFSHQETQDIFDLEEGTEIRSQYFSIQKISQNCVRGEWEGRSILFFADDFSVDEKGAMVSSGVSLEPDFWVMKKNRLPYFLSKPKEGILYTGERAPSKKIKEWAMENEVPLVTARDSGGFLLEYGEKAKPLLLVR